FLFAAPSTSEIYTLSLHDALPILVSSHRRVDWISLPPRFSTAICRGISYSSAFRTPLKLFMFLISIFEPSSCWPFRRTLTFTSRSEEHTSELQSRGHLVCRLLLEK